MKWIKDNGDEIETNDLPATIAHCESLGWERVESGADDDEITAKDIDNIAKQCHDADRKQRKANDDDSLPTWGKAEKEYRDSIINRVKAVIENPDITPDTELPEDQQAQQAAFIETAKAGLTDLVG